MQTKLTIDDLIVLCNTFVREKIAINKSFWSEQTSKQTWCGFIILIIIKINCVYFWFKLIATENINFLLCEFHFNSIEIIASHIITIIINNHHYHHYHHIIISYHIILYHSIQMVKNGINSVELIQFIINALKMLLFTTLNPIWI